MYIIHINKNIIQSNAKHGTSNPICRVEDTLQAGVVDYCMEVVIHGPSQLVYRPSKPRPCGAKLWIETMGPIEMIEKVQQL